ncbi:S-crystallin 4-like [Octopus sinensis]|uniref:S-crystallin 4-like n=1 Tax=Octopus sinensis TaxID=2607531 RepID=A0A6P7SGK2_9MOLL|nr:S-crystallin 4-like [Octopus sinensis]
MPSYTIHYFNHRGRAEVCRMLLAAAGVKYNDRRIESSEWAVMRELMPCSMMPVLEFDDGTKIPQSMAMARFLATEYGFHGNTNMEKLRVDYISECFYDILDDYLRMYHDEHGRMRFEQFGVMSNGTSEKYLRFQSTCRRILPYMEKTLEMRSSGNKFFMGEQMTLADIMCYSALESPMLEDSSFLHSYPKLQSLRNRVKNQPNINNYLKMRNCTEF